eukprot:jgi/Tetstr1/441395/TSEL_029643.t1
MEGGEFGEDIVNFVVHNTAQRQEDQPKEQLSFWGALRRSTMSFPGIHGEGELDVEPIRESVCEEMNASLGKTFSVNMLSWVSRAHEGLLGAVLSHFLDDWGLSVKLRLSDRKLLRFAGTIEKGHHDNPYHGLAHTIDVTARLGTILGKSGFARFLIDSSGADGCLTLLGAMLGAVVHDYKHEGVSNPFVISAGMDQGINFNDQSCLENDALLHALALLRDPSNSPTSHFSRDEQQQLRSLIIKLVLATDMSKHFSILTAVQAKVLDHFDVSLGPEKRYTTLSSEQQHITLQLFLKAADLGHCGLPIESHVAWVDRIQQEFWAQGDREKELNLPLSPLSDREKPGALWGGNQVGFFKALVCPMYAMLTSVAPECQELHANVLSNLAFWKAHPQAPPQFMLARSRAPPKMGTDGGAARVSIPLSASTGARMPPAPEPASLPGSLTEKED